MWDPIPVTWWDLTSFREWINSVLMQRRRSGDGPGRFKSYFIVCYQISTMNHWQTNSETVFDCHLHDYSGTGVEKVLCLQFQRVKQKSREYNQSPMNSTFPCATLGIQSGSKMLAFILQSTEFDFQHQINMSWWHNTLIQALRR